MAGRFAPSPTGALHLGNLRTAVIAWLDARTAGREFLVRMEDLDRVNSSVEHERNQLADLASLGLDHDGDVVRQSDRFDLYDDAIRRLDDAGLVYECYCTRKEIRAQIEAAASAPHGPPGAYPGTCRTLTDEGRRRHRAAGRNPALRLRAPEAGDASTIVVDDLVQGPSAGGLDDVVLRRNDGVPAYNLAVVVDDGLQGVTRVVRGDDLLASTPRQVHLQRLLGLTTPAYAHVPLVVGPDGERLAKRHGAVTVAELRNHGVGPGVVVRWILESLGDAIASTRSGAPTPTAVADAVEDFEVGLVPSTPCGIGDRIVRAMGG